MEGGDWREKFPLIKNRHFHYLEKLLFPQDKQEQNKLHRT